MTSHAPSLLSFCFSSCCWSLCRPPAGITLFFSHLFADKYIWTAVNIAHAIVSRTRTRQAARQQHKTTRHRARDPIVSSFAPADDLALVDLSVVLTPRLAPSASLPPPSPPFRLVVSRSVVSASSRSRSPSSTGSRARRSSWRRTRAATTRTPSGSRSTTAGRAR